MNLSDIDTRRLEDFWQYCRQHQFFNIGYPENADFDYRALHRFLPFSLNNCGDWRESSNYLLNSFDFENEVMQHFASLYGIAFDDSWGYVTNGGTEGNMFGCYLARELFPDGTLYYSQATHYSVAKIARLLRLKTRLIETLPGGEIDCDALVTQIVQDGERHPLIFANIGTTMTGAVDDVDRIQQQLAAAGLPREDYYLHADAALSGMILPFVDTPQPYNFADGIDSISVSGHKMIGSPMPCGIVLARRQPVEHISVGVDYIASRDQTISGSRNGHTPLFLWAALKNYSDSQWRQRIAHCLNMADYAIEQFHEHGIQAWRHQNSVTVVFPCPSDPVWQRHCLARSGPIAHLITMPHHRDGLHIDRLIRDIANDYSRHRHKTIMT